MSAVENYWKRRRRRALGILFVLPLLLLMGFVVASYLDRLVALLTTLWNAGNNSDKVQILSFAAFTSLTAILVCATCAYAWLTWRMMREGVEARRIARQPIIAIKIGQLSFAQRPGRDQVFASLDILVANRGAATAVVAAAEVVVPYGPPAQESDPWLRNGIRVSIPNIPPALDSGQSAGGGISVPVDDYALPQGRSDEVVSVHAKYEDLERNLYTLTQTYNCFRHETKHYLTLASERLTMLPSRRRRHVGDQSLSMTYSEDRPEVIYERVGFM